MFSIDNYGKPVNKKWKFWSKFLTRTLPVYAGIIAAMPDSIISTVPKIWIGVVLSAIVATISGLSEFTAETTKVEETVVNPDEQTNEENNLNEIENEQNKTEKIG